VFAVDEARFGLKTWHRRRWCPRGFRPPWIVQDRYQWLWLYAAVEPHTGESFCLYLPYLDTDCFQRFIDHLHQAYPDDFVVIVMDQAGSHLSEALIWPSQMEALCLPPYSPQLNPAERWFEAVRAVLANRLFATLDELAEALSQALKPYWEHIEKLAQLTGFGWWKKATDNIRTA
jgi:transposase